MRYLALVLAALLLTSCWGSKDKYSDEKMYDLASKLKDLAQSVDGALKFDDVEGMTGKQLIAHVTKKAPQKLKAFKKYDIKVDIQGENAVLLLCDDNVALIEDAGCNVPLDKTLWKKPKKNSCSFTIQSQKICK